jgi:deoxyribodipyrimidine photolyase-related protein
MVPNVYAMSQFAAGEAITTKPYVSGSNYLRRMSDVPAGPWTADWEGLYWRSCTTTGRCSRPTRARG